MPTQPQPITVYEVVRRAVEVCELATPSDHLGALLLRFEDHDEPVSAVLDIEARMDEARRAIDPDGLDPALKMAAAVVVYLAFRRDQYGDDDAELLRLAVRAEFSGRPPADVQQWLDEAGVAV